MQLIVSVPDDFEKSTADVLNDVVTWVISEGSAYVSQWCEMDYGITEIDAAGNCPICYSWDDNLAYRAGICENCYQESIDA